MWSIWNWRNAEVVNGEKRNAQGILDHSDSYIKEYLNAQKQINYNGTQETQRWIAPPLGTFKVNFDGALNIKDVIRGVRIVVRDRAGKIIGAFQKMQGLTNVLSVKAFATVNALEFVKNTRLIRILLEGDALGIINAINSSIPNLSTIGNYVEEAKLQPNDFQLCLVKHTRRTANGTAHVLAKTTLGIDDYVAWIEECLDIIRSIISTDCNSVIS
ncbi:hypothetical protein CRYUN_Cryun21dG0104000 [Craigia yunnanensis]